jgi:hypothetical protein
MIPPPTFVKSTPRAVIASLDAGRCIREEVRAHSEQNPSPYSFAPCLVLYRVYGRFALL